MQRSSPRSHEPFVWSLFAAGGMVGALVLPALVFVLWIASPLGWLELGSPDRLATILLHPVGRVVVFGVVMLCVFHAAHRLRYTLYDGLQLYHLNPLIAALTYGLATALTLVAAALLLVAG
jgi:fumarate reductase subunit D